MKKNNILIVEDEAVVAADLAAKLKRLGYDIAGMARGGEEAVAMADDLRPRLILMDIRLKGSMDGIEAAELVHSRHDVPVIYLTAYSDAATLDRAKLTGPFGYILKPFEERDLVSQIELALYKHKADREIREQREWLRVTLTSIGDAVIATDAEGRITFINPVAESLTGWNSGDAMGLSLPKVFRIVNEQTGDPLEEPITRVLREGRAVALANHAALVTGDGRTVPIEDSASPILNADGQVIGAVLVFHDVKEKRRAEEDLRESEMRLSAILEQLPVGVGLIDSQGQFTQSNSVLREIVPAGILPSSDPGQMERWSAIDNEGRPIPPHQWPGARALRGETVNPGIEFHNSDDDGRKKWLLVSAAPFWWGADEITSAIAVVQDITDRKRTEEALRQLNESLEQQVAERTELAESRARQLQVLVAELTIAEQRERRRLAEILHDNLQQLLVAAKMNSEVMAAKADAGQKQTAEHILDLIDQSIQTSRSLTAELSPPVLEQGGLSAALHWLARWMQMNHGLTVELQVDPAMDPKRENITLLMFQSVRELLLNTVKHAGVKSVKVRMFQDEEDRLRVSVADRGPGFMPETIWEKAQTGTGFGLFSIRERLTLLDGALEIQSSPGNGATFSLIVPLEMPDEKIVNHVARHVIEPHAFQPAGEKIRVLIVDDHTVVRQGLSSMLNLHSDIEVVGEAAEGQAAVRMARDLKPDVILMDVSMPIMDGLEATRIIHSEFPHIRTVGLSMYDEDDQAARMIKAGASAYRSKSGTTDSLLAAIRGEDQ